MAIRILDPEFEEAVGLLDAGDHDRLRRLLQSNPRLLTDVVPLEEVSAGGYFSTPKLMWFVAENPIRNGTLPDNIVTVANTIIDLAKACDANGWQNDVNYTLGLVASGCVPRECGVQRDLIRALVEAGAEPGRAVATALSHREIEACRALIDCGAEISLHLAAGLGLKPDVERLADSAKPEALQEALALAAANGQADCARVLLERGADPNRFNPDGFHAHSTPLHQAVSAGSLATVEVLVDGGAPIKTRDKLFGGDALGWAEHFGRDEIAEFLRTVRT